ncbi:MAG: hypothetical protein IAG10_14760 [Planctomycetaceae bacterium]|nr:hypothetical protein [Planctomycetaceae bacterium]
MTETTRGWVENNEAGIAAALRWNPTSRVPDNGTRPDKSPSQNDESQMVPSPSENSLDHSGTLWLLAARRCEHAEQLDEAWRLHRLGFETNRRQMAQESWQYFVHSNRQLWHYERLAVWVWHPQQTSVRLKQAIAEILADGENVLPPEVILPSEFQRFRVAQGRLTDTDHNVSGDWSWERWLFRRLCPAESQRERQVIDGLELAHQAAFADLRSLTRDLSATWNQPAGDSQLLASVDRPKWLIPSRPKVIGAGMPWLRGRAAELIAKTPRLNFSERNPGSSQQWEAVTQFVSTEGQRRALLLFMAQRAFELDHQRPPKSSDELVPAYLPQRPVTVLSGEDLWTLSQRPRRPSNPNAPDASPRVPTEHSAMQAFHWRWAARQSPNFVRLEVSWTTSPRLLLVSQ